MSSATLDYSAGYSSFALPVLDAHDKRFVAAVVVSLLIHGMALGWLPGIPGLSSSMELEEKLQQLQIKLLVPRVEPAAVSPVPTFYETPRATRPLPPPVIRREAPSVVQPESAPAPVMRATPSVARPETPVISRPEPAALARSEPLRPEAKPSPPERLAVPDAAMLAAYGQELAGAVAKRQNYPRIALLRHWQGTTLLQLELSADGRLLGVRVLSSSGHEILDRQALQMVREAAPLPPMPAAVAGRQITVDVPVVFRIRS